MMSSKKLLRPRLCAMTSQWMRSLWDTSFSRWCDISSLLILGVFCRKSIMLSTVSLNWSVTDVLSPLKF